jgi:DNA polymerase-3 subunit delta'
MSRAPRAARPVEFEPDDALPVRSNPDLYGHDAAAATLERAARSGRLPHAWMAAGPPGIGKATLGYRFAKWLMAGGAETAPVAGQPPLHLAPDHPTFRRIAAGAHADLRALRPNADGGVKQLIRVDDVRAAIRFLAMTPAEGGWRFVLVDSAEAMPPQAANALLKTLEEPPPRAVLMLTTTAPDRLLPTIRSRVRRLDLSPLAPEALDPLLARLLPALGAAERAALGRIAEGSAGRALALAEGEGLALQTLVEEVLAGLTQRDPLDGGRALHQTGAGGVEMVALQDLELQPDRVRWRGLHGDELDEALPALHHRAHDQRLQPIEVEQPLGIALRALRPAPPGIGMRLVRPPRGDAGADGIACPEIHHARGIGVVAHRIAGAPRDSGGGRPHLRRCAAAGRRPAGGAAVLRRVIAADRLPDIAPTAHHRVPSREKLARVMLGRRALVVSAPRSTASARPSSSRLRYSMVRPSKLTRVVPAV